MCRRRATRLVKRVQSMYYGFVKLEEKEVEGYLYNFPRRKSGEGDDHLFSLISSDRMCGNG